MCKWPSLPPCYNSRVRRYANKKDANHTETVELLRSMGCACVDIDLSTGIDLLCGYRSTWFTLELKAKGGRETKRQKAWAERSQACGLPHFVHREGESVGWILDRVKALSHRPHSTGQEKRPKS